MIGLEFSDYVPKKDEKPPFERLLDIFKELMLHSSGNVAEALSWLTQLDKHYELTDDEYSMGDFIQELIDKGFIKPGDAGQPGGFIATSKMELQIRQKALDDVFGQIKKSKRGNHSTRGTGKGDEFSSEVRPYQFGDRLDNLSLTETLKNAHINHGIDNFTLTPDDLEVRETFYQAQTSTVLMIDLSHSMILYGEDRITPAKRVALALSELITTRYPKDTLDVVAFGNDAWQVEIKDLPYLEVGPFHTNTVAGLELAMEILRKRRNPNKQIFLITDGKPTCIKVGKRYYKNPYGLDRKVIGRTLGLAAKARKLGIHITTFMIARDPYLVEFVEQFTAANNGKAYYSSLDGLGQSLFMDYRNMKRKNRGRR